MSIRILQIDAFTSRPFEGNPAAVCLLDAAAPESWMRSVAAEMNLSETAFVVPQRDGGSFGLRWFTPRAEVDLCGHATIAAAHALWEEGLLSRTTAAAFETRSGLLTAHRREDAWIELDFPATPVSNVEVDPEELAAVARALNARVLFAGRSRFDLLVELSSAAAVRSLAPDFRLLATLPVRGLIVTSRSDSPEFDFVSRFFAPAVGVDEDPVTGSAHCCLAPYWASKLDKRELIGRQVSARGGIVKTRLSNDRVLLMGQAVTVLSGKLVVDPS